MLTAVFSEFVDPNPSAGNGFGNTVITLSTGNVVITSPYDDAGGTDAGAVYLYNGATGVLISSLVGSTNNDLVGEYGITELSSGNYLVHSPLWDNGAVANVGAVTFGDGNTGVSGVVSDANSLVGSSNNDYVGFYGSTTITELSNGNYLVSSPLWDNGNETDAGAVTFGNGTTGVSGVVSDANSLVGASDNDKVGEYGITELSTGNYLVRSPEWDNGNETDAGAVTFGSGTTGVSGVVSDVNSLVGSTTDDKVGHDNHNVGEGYDGIIELSNGNYLVSTIFWDNGSATNAGAVTFGDGTTGVSGVISDANSLIGTKSIDYVGLGGVTALTNGNYVVTSYAWDNGSVINVGAVTFGDGTTGVTGAVSNANSLVGSTESDYVGEGGIIELSSGNYLVRSPDWDNGNETDAGAVTFGNGTTGVSGPFTSNNSVIGLSNFDIPPGLVQDETNNTFFIRSQDQKTFRVGSQIGGFSTFSLNVLSDVILNENASEHIVNLVGISASGPDPNQLSVTATSSNTGLIPNPVVSYTSSDTFGSLAFTPVVNEVGISTITVTVEDGGLDGDLGTIEDNGTFQRTFDVIVKTLVDIDFRVISSPTSVESNGEVSILPDHQTWVHEWATFWVEIWVNTPNTESQGIFSVNLDLNYHTQYSSATSIEYGPGFTHNQTGSIDDTGGVVKNLSAETNVTNLGVSEYLLFARVKFESFADDHVDLDIVNQLVSHHDLGFSVSSIEVILVSNNPVQTNFNPFGGVDIWANPFDLNDNDVVDFRDLILFAAVYQQKPSESSNHYAWFSDYNQNDRVDFRDLVIFASNYRKSKVGDSDINDPANFPDAWDNPLLVSMQPQTQTKEDNVTQAVAEQVFENAVEHVSERLSSEVSQTLANVEVKVVDLAGANLGRAIPGTIYLDVNAAGYGWFVDDTPLDHSEFAFDSQLSLIALPESAAAGHVDLWTVILHEIGHLVGYEHEPEGLMAETLAPGVRKLADWEESSDLFFASMQEDAELLPF